MYDVVWYWTGGREIGKWRESTPERRGAKPTREEIRVHCATLDRAGYINHPGSLNIGPPEGPPDDAEFRALGL